MTLATNFKLGLFTLAGIGGLTAAAVVLGLHVRKTPTAEYHTLFDESVQGLDLGAPVKYRGVKIGNVAAIAVAPDRRHIDVAMAIDTRQSTRLGLASAPPALRTHLASQGLTGVKFVDLDFASEDETAEAITTPGADGLVYLPSQPSLATELEDEVLRLGRTLPKLADGATATLHRIDGVLDDVRGQQVPERLASLLDQARGAIDDVRRLTPKAAALVKHLDVLAGDSDAAVGGVRQLIGHIDAGDGLAASAQRATDALGELGHRGLESTDGLQRSIDDVDQAARALRAFVDELERDPDMLVKGHAHSRRR